MDLNKYIPVCKNCGVKLGQVINTINEDPFVVCSSDYIENWGYCRTCMIEYCCTTNCLECGFNTGKYSNCSFFDMKQYYMSED